MKKKEIELEFAKMWIEDDGIIRTVVSPGTIIDVKKIRAIIGSFRQLSGHDGNRILFDMAGVKTTDKETRDFGLSEEAVKTLKAAALIALSPVAKMIGNIFIKLTKPPYPTKLFTDKEKALTWLKSFADKDQA